MLFRVTINKKPVLGDESQAGDRTLACYVTNSPTAYMFATYSHKVINLIKN